MAATASAGRRPGVVAVHSLDRFVFTVPDLAVARSYFGAFGLDVRDAGADRIDLFTFGHPHCWGTVIGNGQPKKLQYLRFGSFADDLPAFRERIAAAGLGASPHPLGDGDGLWLKDPDGLSIQLVVAPQSAPGMKSVPAVAPTVAPGRGAAPSRSQVKPVRPRRLSHLLRFSPDVPRMVRFCAEVLGIRLSDKSGDGIAFLHGAHGSDHHMVAFAMSEGSGLHHTSWDVASFDEVGNGAEQMRKAGHTQGWGVGRHVLGSNYFHYVRDPWGSFTEYSFDIDHVPADLDWPAGDHPPEDSFYVWGPAVPEDFVVNHERA